jgi:phosphate transport system substrate-binding protein
MTQRNDTVVLIASLALTAGLIGGGVWWFTRQSGGNLPNSTDGAAPPATDGTAPPATDGTAPPATDTPAGITPGAGMFADVNAPQGTFNYGGSTTWAPIRGEIDPVLQASLPQFQLRYTDSLNAPPGSGTGIAMLLNNQLAFSQSSRALNTEEYQQAQQRGFTVVEVPVALEGIAIAVHPGLNVPGLTIQQLQQIYIGQITNWSEVGGPNQPITPYSRPAAGGTVEFFVEEILAGQDFAPSVQFVPNTTQALRVVSEDVGGIYYASAPEVIGQCTTKPLPLGRQSSQLVAPYLEPLVPESECPGRRNQINPEVFQSGAYPITRPLFVIIRQDGQASQQAGEAYANLLLTDQGQSLIEAAGFVRIR